MTAPRYLVTGATGNVGRPLVDQLAARGHPVRAASRRGGPDEGPVQRVAFDFTDPGTWDRTFEGVEAMFLMRPPQVGRPERDMFPALRQAAARGLRHVVFLSVQGVDRIPFAPHRTVESWLRQSPLTWTFLRASFFDQNLVAVHGDAIRRFGALVIPAGRGRTAFVDAEDVAAVGVEALLDPERHGNRAYTPTGAEALTYFEVAETMTEVLGRPIRYRAPGLLRYAVLARRQLGLPLDTIAVTSVVYTTARLGLAAGLTDDVRTVTGRPPVTVAGFVARERAAFLPAPAPRATGR